MKRISVVFILFILALVGGERCRRYTDKEIERKFKQIYKNNVDNWIELQENIYMKIPTNKTMEERRQMFRKMMSIINKHNYGKPTYCQGPNKFLAMDDAEFESGYLGRLPGEGDLNATITGPSSTPKKCSIVEFFLRIHKRELLPPAVDYRPFMGPVNDQYRCGSCWAFAASHTVSAVLSVLKGEYPTDYSEQQLIDCAYALGCRGGYAQNGFVYLGDNEFRTEYDYPYMAKAGLCRVVFRSSKKRPVQSWGRTHPFGYPDPEAIKRIVAKQPITLAMYVDKNFKAYKNGVYVPSPKADCSSNFKLNHEITVAGYGTDPYGGDYWLLKNNWGADWGDHGYVKIKRGINACNIEIDGRYPIVADDYVPTRRRVVNPPPIVATVNSPCVNELRQCAYYGSPACKVYDGDKQTTKRGFPCKMLRGTSHSWPKPCKNTDNDKAPWCYVDAVPNWDFCFAPC